MSTTLLRAPHQRGVTVKDIPAELFIQEYAKHLKNAGWLKVPQWVDIVKTSCTKELAPLDPDWFYYRAASIARKVYLNHGIGIGALRRSYAEKKRAGPKGHHTTKTGGAIIRLVLKLLEEVGTVAKCTDGDNNPTKGRYVTRDGRRDLDAIAGRIATDLGDRFYTVNLE